jgi:hypothetical protein
MSAGIVQLIAIGAQDEYIVGNPKYLSLVQHSKDMLIFHSPSKSKQSMEQ